jgi:hypothetical protein
MAPGPPSLKRTAKAGYTPQNKERLRKSIILIGYAIICTESSEPKNYAKKKWRSKRTINASDKKLI